MGAMNAEEMKNYKGVFVFAQQVDNKLSGISFELIGEGKRLAEKLDEKVTAVLIGSDVKGLVDELAEYARYGNAVASLCVEKRGGLRSIPEESEAMERLTLK